MPEIAEPLAELASFAWEQAPHLCSEDHGCRDYHRVWSYLRLLGTISATAAGKEFFVEEFDRLAREGKRRVLISGAADTGMLTQVVRGYRRAGVQPQIVFLDRCATPVAQNRFWAEQLGLDCEYICADIRDLDCAPVDAVCTHSFLFFFTPDERPAVVEAWRRNLRPGGVVITSNRIAPAPTPTQPMSNEEIASRTEALRASAGEHGIPADLAAQIARAAEGMWSASRHDRVTEAEVRALMDAAGLEVVRFSYQGNKDGQKSSFNNAFMAERRAEIIARRPA